MRVLLVSPLDPDKPADLKFLMGGENTYTRTLLANPPKGVVYVHHTDAIKRGLVVYHPMQRILALLVKLRILPLSSGTQCLVIRGKFDLVHCHGYSIRVFGARLPLVISDSSANYLFLRDYLGWGQWRIKIGYLLRKKLFGWLGVVDADTNLEGAQKLIVFSEFAKRVHLKLGAPKTKMTVIPPGLSISDTGSEPKRKDKNINILFVGIWFERKGGPLVLEAFRRLSKKYKNIRLTIVGPIPKRFMIYDLRFMNYDFVPREKLMREFFPKADIFVIAPPKVEGFGFAVVEAMSFGIPVIVSRICALPELVEDGKTGFVIKPGSFDELAEKLEVMITNQSLRKKMGEAAKARFEEKFSIAKSNEALLKIYRQALA